VGRASIASAAGNIRSRFRDLGTGIDRNFAGPARVRKLRRQYRDLADRYPAADHGVEPRSAAFPISG